MRKVGLRVLLPLLLVLLVGCSVVSNSKSTPPKGSSNKVASVPLLKANQTKDQLITEPDDGKQPFLDAINQAKKSIDIEMYLLTDTDILNAIVKAADRGVQVRVILESSPGGSTSSAKSAKTFLESAKSNIQVKWAPSRFKFDHAKTLVVDQSTTIFGSANYTTSGVSSNREYDVRTTQTNVVQAIESVFHADWTNQKEDSKSRKTLVLSPGSEPALMQVIRHAKPGGHVYMEEEETPDAALQKAMIDQVKKGVKVTLLVAGTSSNTSGVGAYQLAKLASAGIKVGTVDSPYIHAKMILSGTDLNQWVELGSENVSANSLFNNREVGAIYESPYFAAAMEVSFKSDLKGATELPATLPKATSVNILGVTKTPSKYMGRLVNLQGTVEAINGYTAYMAEDQSGKAAGLEVWLGSVSKRSMKQGDLISVPGYISQYEGHYELEAVDTPVVKGKGVLPYIPVVQTGDLASYSGLLVRVQGTPSGSGNQLSINDGSGKAKLVTLDGGELTSVPSGWKGYAIVLKVKSNFELAPVTIDSSLQRASSPYEPLHVNAPVVTLKELAESHDKYVNKPVQIKGATVTAIAKYNAYIEQNGFGMALYPAPSHLLPGDVIDASGTFKDYNGDTEISDGSAKVNKTGKAPKPITITIADASKNNYRYVTVTGKVTEVKGVTATISDSKGHTLSVYHAGGFKQEPKVGKTLTFKGIISNYKGTWEISVID